MSQVLPEPTDIRAFLGQFRGETIYYQPNPGNAGDAWIAAATFQIFRDAQVSITRVTADADLKGKTIAYGGGGNLVPLYDDARRFLLQHHATAKTLIVLPQSISGNEDLLASLGCNVILICREGISYAHACRHAPRAQVLLSPEMVLNVDPNAILHTFDRISPFPLGFRLFRALLAPRLALQRRLFTSGKVLTAFRSDQESVAPETEHPGNIDVSRLFRFKKDLSEPVALAVSTLFLRFVSRFQEIRTDRLHVSIAAAMLGKTVFMHPNSTGKNCGIYESWLRHHYPNVRFVD